MKQLVEAAIDMHSKKMFHRDLKPENILIQTTSEGPRVRIIDFGCSSYSKDGSYHSFAGTVLLLLFIHLLISGVMAFTEISACSSSFVSVCLLISCIQEPMSMLLQSFLKLRVTRPSPPQSGSWVRCCSIWWMEKSHLTPVPSSAVRSKSSTSCPKVTSQ